MSRFLNSSVKWAAGSWSLFIAENFVLSENRTTIISKLGDDNYHYAYGLCSTAAVGSIAYGYQYKVKNQGPMLWKAGSAVPLPGKIIAFMCLGLGMGLMSQTAPKFQIPLEYINGESSEKQKIEKEEASSQAKTLPSTELSAPPSSSSKWKVRCPFDFTDAKAESLEGGVELHGMDRVTRHPGLWSFGLAGMGLSYLTPSVPTRVWLFMPIVVALIGGEHTDSRHRRGMGGTLTKELDEQTSNIPFLALINGKQEQGDGTAAFGKLFDELKGLNGLIALGVAAIFVASKGRATGGRVSKLRTTNS
eukprot:scaffold141_cov238-Chaetoceros_neogracile.AAC.3